MDECKTLDAEAQHSLGYFFLTLTPEQGFPGDSQTQQAVGLALCTDPVRL